MVGLLRKLTLQGLLSFRDVSLELRPLNVLIGPNASGKSNLIEAVGLLQAAPRGLPDALRRGGGIEEWLWKGERTAADRFTLGTILDPFDLDRYPLPGSAGRLLEYSLSITKKKQSFEILEESLHEGVESLTGERTCLFRARHGEGTVYARALQGGPTVKHELKIGLPSWQSVLHERRDPVHYPEMTLLAQWFDGIRLYREWDLEAIRRPQPTDVPGDVLEEDGSNLILVLNHLENENQQAFSRIEERLDEFYPQFKKLAFRVEAGTVQLLLHEKGMVKPIPATRLSDGTLRFLCMLGILCHPTPPPLVGIEEPELGIHPDILPRIAELLREASERTQLMVTTHSDVLIDALSDGPEAVIVCERDFSGQTEFRRLSQDKLDAWLEDYRLGQLWRKGELGGTRW